MPDSITSIPCPALRPFRSDHEPFGVWALSSAGIPRKSTSINAGSEVRSDHTLGFRYSDQFRAGEGSECPKLWRHLPSFLSGLVLTQPQVPYFSLYFSSTESIAPTSGS